MPKHTSQNHPRSTLEYNTTIHERQWPQNSWRSIHWPVKIQISHWRTVGTNGENRSISWISLILRWFSGFLILKNRENQVDLQILVIGYWYKVLFKAFWTILRPVGLWNPLFRTVLLFLLSNLCNVNIWWDRLPSKLSIITPNFFSKNDQLRFLRLQDNSIKNFVGVALQNYQNSTENHSENYSNFKKKANELTLLKSTQLTFLYFWAHWTSA